MRLIADADHVFAVSSFHPTRRFSYRPGTYSWCLVHTRRPTNLMPYARLFITSPPTPSTWKMTAWITAL